MIFWLSLHILVLIPHRRNKSEAEPNSHPGHFKERCITNSPYIVSQLQGKWDFSRSMKYL